MRLQPSGLAEDLLYGLRGSADVVCCHTCHLCRVCSQWLSCQITQQVAYGTAVTLADVSDSGTL